MATVIATELLTAEQITQVKDALRPHLLKIVQLDEQFATLERRGPGFPWDRATMQEEARNTNSTIEEIAAPLWVHLDQFDVLKDIAGTRPRALRGTGARLLPYIAQFSLWENGDVLAKAVLKWAVDTRSDNPDRWNQAAGNADCYLQSSDYLEATQEVIRESTINIATQVQERGVMDFLVWCYTWHEQREQRAMLNTAGRIVGSIDAGEIRSMDPDAFGALGSYLGCCIGGSEYGPTYEMRWDDGEAVYLCVYDEDRLPTVLVEVYLNDDFDFGDVQSRHERGGDQTTLQQLRDWLTAGGREAFDMEPADDREETTGSSSPPVPAKPQNIAPAPRPVKPQAG